MAAQNTISEQVKNQINGYYEKLVEKLPELVNQLNLNLFERLVNLSGINLSDDQIHFTGFVMQQLFALLSKESKRHLTFVYPYKAVDLENKLCPYHMADALGNFFQTEGRLYSSLHFDFLREIDDIICSVNRNLYDLLHLFQNWKISLGNSLLGENPAKEERGPRITFVLTNISDITKNGFNANYAHFDTSEGYFRFIGKYETQLKSQVQFYSNCTYQCQWCHPWFGSIVCHQLSKGFSLESNSVPNGMRYMVTDRSYQEFVPDLKPKIAYQNKMDETTYMLEATKKCLFEDLHRSHCNLMYENIVEKLWEKSTSVTDFHAKLSQLQAEIAQKYASSLDNIVIENEHEAIKSNFMLLRMLVDFQDGRKTTPRGPSTPTYSANGRSAPKPMTLEGIPIKVDKRLNKKKK